MPISKMTLRPVPGVKGIRTDGTVYVVRLEVRDPKTGRKLPTKRKVCGSLREALLTRETLTEKKDVERVRFSDFAEQWLEAVSKRIGESTSDRYVYALAHLDTAFGEFWLDQIEAKDVALWRDRIVGPGCAPATVNGMMRILRSALDSAVERGLVTANVAKSVKALPEKRTKGRRGTSFTIEELRRFLETVESMRDKEADKLNKAKRDPKAQKEEKAKRDKESLIAPDVVRLIATIAWTGMRLGELRALKWQDWCDGELNVRHSVYKRTEKATKTDDPRKIVVVEPLALVLQEQRNWLLETQHPGLASGLVFPARPAAARAGATRRGVDELSWYRATSLLRGPLGRAVAKANVPDVCAHSFRRSFENMFRRAGVSDLVRRSLAGWRSEDAQEIYAGVGPAERKAAGEAAVRLVYGGKV